MTRVVSKEDAPGLVAGYREAVPTLLGRLRRPRISDQERVRAEERLRIARELHDVVAHSLSEMVVQASGVRCQLTPDQTREREALLSVEQIGHDALSEMRHMLGAMQQVGESPDELAPQPSLTQLDRLIAAAERDGRRVSLRIEGERPKLPIGIELSAYRIVEEALAHANGGPTDVLVRYADRRVEIEIGGTRRSSRDGLAQMSERVALYGGTLETGPRAGGGYVVRAQLPVEAKA
jgi:signal transduction histidine kinase